MAARRVPAWLVATTLAMACSEPSDPTETPSRASLSVAVVSGPVPQFTTPDGTPIWNTFTVEVLVKNQSGVVARIPGCGPALERESQPGTWNVVAEALCALGAGDARELPPMSERQWQQTIGAAARSATVPPGRVRLLFRYGAVGQVGALDEARSEPFELK